MQGGDIMNESISDHLGAYQFEGVNHSQDYMIMPRGNDEYTLGLSTFDLLKLAKHIYGITILDSDAEILAADADQNGQVNVQDLLVLRRLLLNYSTNLPNNKAWRFIPTDILADDDFDPMNSTFNEYWQVEDLYDNYKNIDFTAIKIGDINGSVRDFGGAEERTAELSIELETNQNGEAIEFLATRSLDINGFQMELNIGNELIESIIPGKMSVSLVDAKVLASSTLISWFLVEESVGIQAGDVLFSIDLKNNEIVSPELLDARLVPEMYSSNDVIYDIELKNVNEEIEVATEQAEISIYPNPSKLNARFQIVSMSDKIEEVIVYDSQGQLTKVANNVGLNEVSIDTENFKKRPLFNSSED